MPELAEVEVARQAIEKVSRGHGVSEVNVDLEDRFFYAFAKPELVKKALTGAKVTGSGRRGKYFWLKLDRKPWPIFHLGMTGHVSIFLPKAKGRKPKVWAGVEYWNATEENEPKRLWFSRIALTLDNEIEIAIRDPRRFGRMWLSDDPENESRIKRLGPDPLVDFWSDDDFAAKLKRRRAPIKSVLLDQKLCAGVGNWLADEILYHARFSPHRIAAEMSPKDIKKLRKSIVEVCEKAVAMKADYDQFPATWLFSHRWGKSKEAKVNGKKITHDEIGGRTSAWVPGVQK